MADENKDRVPESLDEAKDIATFFQAFGYANALRAILDQVKIGELDIGPKASGFLATQLALAQKRPGDGAEVGAKFIDFWDAEPESQTLHTLEDILGLEE